MKKTIIFLAVLLGLPVIMVAQTVEVTPFGGYVFGGTMHGDYGDVHINDNAQYGGMISFAVSRVMDVDLIYNRSDTKAQGYMPVQGTAFSMFAGTGGSGAGVSVYSALLSPLRKVGGADLVK